MRADHCAFAALDTGFRVPHRNLERDVALLPFGGPGGKRPIGWESAHGYLTAVPSVDQAEHMALKLGCLGRERGWHFGLAGRLLRHADFEKVGQCFIYGAQVLLYDLFTLLAVGVTDGLANGLNCLLARQNL